MMRGLVMRPAKEEHVKRAAIVGMMTMNRSPFAAEHLTGRGPNDPAGSHGSLQFLLR